MLGLLALLLLSSCMNSIKANNDNANKDKLIFIDKISFTDDNKAQLSLITNASKAYVKAKLLLLKDPLNEELAFNHAHEAQKFTLTKSIHGYLLSLSSKKKAQLYGVYQQANDDQLWRLMYTFYAQHKPKLTSVNSIKKDKIMINNKLSLLSLYFDDPIQVNNQEIINISNEEKQIKIDYILIGGDYKKIFLYFNEYFLPNKNYKLLTSENLTNIFGINIKSKVIDLLSIIDSNRFLVIKDVNIINDNESMTINWTLTNQHYAELYLFADKKYLSRHQTISKPKKAKSFINHIGQFILNDIDIGDADTFILRVMDNLGQIKVATGMINTSL